MIYKLYIQIILSLLVLPAVMAQKDTAGCLAICCHFSAQPPTVMTGVHHESGQWMIAYQYSRMNMSGMQRGTQQVHLPDVFQNYQMGSDRMTMQMHMLMGMVGISNRLTLMGMVHFMNNSMQMKMPPETDHSTHQHAPADQAKLNDVIHSSGFGDTRLNLSYKVISDCNHQVSLYGGISIPTGSYYTKGQAKTAYAGQRLPYNMQLGSGTWDLSPGFLYSYSNNLWSLGGSASYLYRTAMNSVHYQLGNEATITLWISRFVVNRLFVYVKSDVAFIGTMRGKDIQLYRYAEPAANPENSGGQRISGVAGLGYAFNAWPGKENKVAAEFSLPFYQNLHGIQMPLTSGLSFNYSILF